MDYPTPIFTTLFFYAPQNRGDPRLIVQNDRKSILRKRYYSFKLSGILRGGHRGPEEVCSDWQSGLKMNEFSQAGDRRLEFVKKGYASSGCIRLRQLASVSQPVKPHISQTFKHGKVSTNWPN
jgi:hypothetical protein